MTPQCFTGIWGVARPRNNAKADMGVASLFGQPISRNNNDSQPFQGHFSSKSAKDAKVAKGGAFGPFFQRLAFLALLASLGNGAGSQPPSFGILAFCLGNLGILAFLEMDMMFHGKMFPRREI